MEYNNNRFLQLYQSSNLAELSAKASQPFLKLRYILTYSVLEILLIHQSIDLKEVAHE